MTSLNDHIFPRYWPFVRRVHRSPVNSTHKGQCRGPSCFGMICAWTKGWVNNLDAGGLRCNRAHYSVTLTIATTRSFASLLPTVYPKKYAHGFVVFCFVVVMQSFIMNSHEVFIHIYSAVLIHSFWDQTGRGIADTTMYQLDHND